MEKNLRKHEHLCGTWVLLGNGEKWCIPALPLGKQRHGILTALKKLDGMQHTVEGSDDQVDAIGNYLDTAADFMAAVMQVNYSGITKELLDEHNLLSMQHIPVFVNIVRGESELGEIIGVTPRDEGESKSRARMS